MNTYGSSIMRNKNVVITGCLKGIGRVTMETMARNGANIWACAQYQDAGFERDIANLAQEYDIWIIPVYFDLCESDQIRQAAKLIMSSKKPIDALVNIAGVTYNSLFHMTSIDSMKKVFEINFFSQMMFTQYISKVMLKQKSGSIVSIASFVGLDGNRGQIAYSASKAAVIGATKTLAAELSESGIRVNAVAPGVIDTDMTADLPQQALEDLMAGSLIRRKGYPEEVANAVLFLASDLSSFITGQILRVDGGIG